MKKQCISLETGETMPGNINCGTYVCPVGYVCGKTMTNPNYGTTSFDNIYKAVLLVF